MIKWGWRTSYGREFSQEHKSCKNMVYIVACWSWLESNFSINTVFINNRLKLSFNVSLLVWVLCVGEALDYLHQNIFTEAAGARKGFPKVAVVITDGKSQDPVEGFARKLRNSGVEIFALGECPEQCLYRETFRSVPSCSALSLLPLGTPERSQGLIRWVLQTLSSIPS